MTSIWNTTEQISARPALDDSIETEAAVIGGGMAGVLTAYFLQQAGLRTVVLEAGRMGSGQTGRTTAKITSQHGPVYRTLIRSFGMERAGQYAHSQQQAIEAYEQLIQAEKIDCDFERLPAYLYTTDPAGADALRQEAQAAARLGIDAAFTEHTVLPMPVKGAVRFENQAQFHPMRFLRAVASSLTIYENTRVQEVKGGLLRTNGGSVRAKYVVFACHYPFLNLPGYYFMRMHQSRSYVLALEGAQKLDGVYLGVDRDGLSLRNSGDQMLLGGGGHRTGENSAGGKYETLRRQARALWPQSRETACWSAQDCMTMDGLPYIGPYAQSQPRWYVATGFAKWGMTNAMSAALVLRDQITGRKNPDAAVFSPQRFTPGASAKTFLEDGMHAVRDLSRRLFAPPKAMLDELPAGHGGVVEYDGEKVGVYKDEDGELFFVSVKCPHLGCQLEWNPDEKSWDCPCHGSRFDYTGRLLDNPAQTSLSPV